MSATITHPAPGTSHAPKVPTAEQIAATEAFRAGDHLVIQAGAGTGKTTTLSMLAHCTRPRRPERGHGQPPYGQQGQPPPPDPPEEMRHGRYLAFNRTIARDAARRFPPQVACGTAHALAYAAVGKRYRHRLSAPRRAGWKTGEALGIDAGMSVRIGARKVTSRALSFTALRTVTRFCQSADESITAQHVPRLRGAESDASHAQLAQLVLPYAHKAWADLRRTEQGVVRFEHDHYLKMWALDKPVIAADFLLLDEAQDTNPVVEQVFVAQRGHAQLVLVGDSAQAIYGWRGARDVMTGFDGRQLSLSQSFRFGPALAEEANRWLSVIDAPIRLNGSPLLTTEVGATPDADAVVCRSNAGAMVEVIRLLEKGRRVALVGGGGTLGALARAAHDLRSGCRTSHPELLLFDSWEELREYAERDPSGRDLLPLVQLVDDHGTEAVLEALGKLVDEGAAEVTVSTAHRAKGREWPTVRIAEDFTAPDDLDEVGEDGQPLPGPIDPDEARLAYVAVTRARLRLDVGGLSWINSHPAGDPRAGGAARPGAPPRTPRAKEAIKASGTPSAC
ncbi:UvrD-helicase domain-containing protein [Streptomyces sp. MST-110588]|uniref:UvrD-helicase domain-containing protein n=1 Tax=Streptomyces sp. MST-110588 TaxID=2833628 RepID=UPI001F5DC9C3|nr:UvrD-helicase domain-containing protein [Streptomyces sp. MST-110588]UNO42678.1 ATP-dependent helicase [Streptomyces sp. MST-110588]